MQTQKFGVDAFDALFSKSIEFQKYVTNIETAVKDKYNTAIWNQWYPTADAYDDGDAVKVIEVIKTAAVMLDGRTRYSEFTQADHDGASSYSCSLPDFGKGFFYTMQDKEKIDKLNTLLGANGAIIDGYTDKAINLVEGAYGTLDVMALQLTSKAEIDYTYGMGINYKQTAPVPAANKQKSGTLVWSDVDAPILDRMHEAEKYLQETLNYTGPIKWRWAKKIMDFFLKNKQVISAVGAYLNSKGVVVQQSWGITIDQYNDWVVNGSNNGYVSKIELVPDTYALEQKLSGRTQIKPWDDDMAVLSPDMADGTTRYKAPTEFTNLQGVPNHSVSVMQGGMLAFDNYISQTRYPEWHTDMIMSAAPTMAHWNYIIYIDAFTANS